MLHRVKTPDAGVQHLRVIFGSLLSICSLVVTVRAADFVQPEPLEPKIAKASEEATQTMAGISIPDGWKIELFASEPDVANIVAFDIDHQGRVYACESFRQNRGVTDNRGHDEAWLLADLSAETVQDRIDYHKRLLGEGAVTYAQHDDRIRLLADTDGDGKADRSTVFAKGFNRLEEGTGAGVLARGNSVFYTCIPRLWKLIDSNQDGKADERVVLSDGYGVRVAFRGHDMHGLLLGPDGRLYFSIGDRGYHVTTAEGRVLANPAVGAVFRCELDGSGLEVYCNGLRNPQELAFNDVGDLFSVDNNSDSGDRARIVHLLEGGDSGWRMYYQYLPDRGPFNREKIWEPFHQDQPAYIVPPVANFTDGPSGLAFYPGTGFGDQLKDTFLICDFRGGPSNSGIRSFQLEPQGAFYNLGENDQPIWTVLATDVAFGPDGELYVSDWVDGWEGLGKGRIYRLRDPRFSDSEAVREVASLLASNWSELETSRLKSLLGHADRRVRLEAQWELAARKAAQPLLEIAQEESLDSLQRLHAVWGADQIARLDAERRPALLDALRPLLTDPEAILRAAAAKVAGERGDQASAEQLVKLLSDDNARVRYFATMSLGKLQYGQALNSVASLLNENDNHDPALRHAGIFYLQHAASPKQIVQLASEGNVSLRRAAVVALRRLGSEQVARFVDDEARLVRVEAARAIHDQPIAVAMDELAKALSNNVRDAALVHRALNANFRLGTTEAAARIAAFAADMGSDKAMRIEALDMLANFAKPDPRDRVTNQFRPLSERDEGVAANALKPHIQKLMAAPEPIREKAIEVASGLGIRDIVPMLVKRINNGERRAQLRASSLLALSRLDGKLAVRIANDVEPNSAGAFYEAALTVLGQLDAQSALPKFVAATDSSSREVRQKAWDLLSAVPAAPATEAIEAGVRKYMSGELPEDVQLNVLQAAQGRISDQLRESLDQFRATQAENDPLAEWTPALKGGNVDLGKRLFFGRTELSCVRCHKVDRAGGEVGPNLTTIGKTRDRRYLLESICLPNAKIAEGFETAVIATADGKLVNGIVQSESDDQLELILADGSQIRLDQDEIVARKRGKSSMPADLAKLISPRELRDLVAYLASLRVDPRAEDEVE